MSKNRPAHQPEGPSKVVKDPQTAFPNRRTGHRLHSARPDPQKLSSPKPGAPRNRQAQPDIKILLELATAGLAHAKVLVECSTLTVSIHREKAPVRACGYINPKGFARGRRTIAGTLILTQFTVDALFRFLLAVLPQDLSQDTHYFKVDQLPPFNATILFSDEHGNASYRRLLGLEFITDGTVYSIQDLLSEQTISYMASDFTPLLPVTHGVVFGAGISGGCPEPILLKMVPPSTRAPISPLRFAAVWN